MYEINSFNDITPDESQQTTILYLKVRWPEVHSRNQGCLY